MNENTLNDTFKKHLKLLKEHLNINEYYEEPETERPDWDPDGLTGTRQRVEKRPKFTIKQYAAKAGWSNEKLNDFLTYLNTSQHNGGYGGFDFDEYSEFPGTSILYHFNAYLRNYLEKEKEKQLINKKVRLRKLVDKYKNNVIYAIKNMGMLDWRKYKKMSFEEKIDFLSLEIRTDIDNIKKSDERQEFEKLFGSIEKDEIAKEMLKDMLEDAETLAKRGFFESKQA